MLGLLHGLCFLPVYLSIVGRWSTLSATLVTETRVQSVEKKDVIANPLSNDDVPQSSKKIDDQIECHAVDGSNLQEPEVLTVITKL
jgi:hypothetical protein